MLEPFPEYTAAEMDEVRRMNQRLRWAPRFRAPTPLGRAFKSGEILRPQSPTLVCRSPRLTPPPRLRPRTHSAAQASCFVACHPYTTSPNILGELLRRMLLRKALESRLDSREDDLARLTPREREVLDRIALGLTNKAIARELGIGPGTVKAHVEKVIAKLGVVDRTQAAVLATRANR